MDNHDNDDQFGPQWDWVFAVLTVLAAAGCGIMLAMGV